MLGNDNLGLVWNMATYSGTAEHGLGSAFSATGATSVVGTIGATFYITGVQLEAGSSATEFEHRQYGTELSLCQRYYNACQTTLTSHLTKPTQTTKNTLSG
jgi:hypothetical protein